MSSEAPRYHAAGLQFLSLSLQGESLGSPLGELSSVSETEWVPPG